MERSVNDIRNDVIQARLYYETYGRNGLRDPLELLGMCEQLLKEYDELDKRRRDQLSNMSSAFSGAKK